MDCRHRAGQRQAHDRPFSNRCHKKCVAGIEAVIRANPEVTKKFAIQVNANLVDKINIITAYGKLEIAIRSLEYGKQ